MTVISPLRSLGTGLLPLVLASAAVGCAQASAAEKATAAAEALSVTTAEVVEKSVPNTVTVTGTLLPNRESEVAFSLLPSNF